MEKIHENFLPAKKNDAGQSADYNAVFKYSVDFQEGCTNMHAIHNKKNLPSYINLKEKKLHQSLPSSLDSQNKQTKQKEGRRKERERWKDGGREGGREE